MAGVVGGQQDCCWRPTATRPVPAHVQAHPQQEHPAPGRTKPHPAAAPRTWAHQASHSSSLRQQDPLPPGPPASGQLPQRLRPVRSRQDDADAPPSPQTHTVTPPQMRSGRPAHLSAGSHHTRPPPQHPCPATTARARTCGQQSLAARAEAAVPPPPPHAGGLPSAACQLLQQQGRSSGCLTSRAACCRAWAPWTTARPAAPDQSPGLHQQAGAQAGQAQRVACTPPDEPGAHVACVAALLGAGAGRRPHTCHALVEGVVPLQAIHAVAARGRLQRGGAPHRSTGNEGAWPSRPCHLPGLSSYMRIRSDPCCPKHA